MEHYIIVGSKGYRAPEGKWTPNEREAKVYKTVYGAESALLKLDPTCEIIPYRRIAWAD